MDVHLLPQPFFTNDAIVLGLLLTVLALIFYTSSLKSSGWTKFYGIIPALLLCYFVPALLHWPLGLIASEWHNAGGIQDMLIGMNLIAADASPSLGQMEAVISEFNLGKAKDYLTSLNVPFPENASAADVGKVYGQCGLNVNDSGIITSDQMGSFVQKSKLYKPLASRYLLPASLILLCLGIDMKAIINLGMKPIIMFLAATFGIIIGGPIALLLITSLWPDLIPAHPNDVWRGLSTVAGSWIGGGANQTAMKEIFDVKDNLFATMIIVDVVVANIWMAFLLYGANVTERVDKWLKADVSSIERLKESVSKYSASVSKMPTTTTMFLLLAIAFGGVGLSHWAKDVITPRISNYNKSTKVEYVCTKTTTLTGAQAKTETISLSSYKGLECLQKERGGTVLNNDRAVITVAKEVKKPGSEGGVLVDKGLSSLMSSFFWLVVFATTIGLILSFTKARELEGVGASRWGSVFIYVLVATIGMKMNISEVYDNLGLFAVGIVWMLVHVTILLITAKIIKAPFFFVAVGSQANIGGAASAPIVASAFSPVLAPVGVLMAVLGYALGTYGALICAYLMQAVSGG